MGSPAIAFDVTGDNGFLPDYLPVVPDATSLDLPGQFNSMPGGSSADGSVMMADGSGVNAVYLHPSVNPNPTGGWMQTAQAVIQLAAQGAKTYASGSPTTAVPPARRPLQSVSWLPGSSSTMTGTNWIVIGAVVIIGAGAMIALGVL